MTPEIEAQVRVTETVSLPGARVSDLLDQVRMAFSRTHRIARLTYTRGEPLRVERMVPLSIAEAEREVFTAPFAFARQNARILVQDREGRTTLETVLAAFRTCAQEKMPAQFLLCNRITEATRWVFPDGVFQLEESFHLPIYEDPDVPAGCLAVCGSGLGELIADMELCVLCPSKE